MRGQKMQYFFSFTPDTSLGFWKAYDVEISPWSKKGRADLTVIQSKRLEGKSIFMIDGYLCDHSMSYTGESNNGNLSLINRS